MWSLIRVCKLIVWNGRENSKKELIHNEHLKTTVPMTNTLIKFLFFLIFFIYFFFLLFFLYVYLIFFLLISHDLYSAHDFNFHWTHWHEPLSCWCVLYVPIVVTCASFFSSEIIKKWMNFFRLTTNNSFFLLLYTQLI